MRLPIEFLPWEPEPSIRLDAECAWTAAVVLHGRRSEDQIYEMSVLGGLVGGGPATWDVTGPLSGECSVIAKGVAPSFEQACCAAETSVRRTIFRVIRGAGRDRRSGYHPDARA
jgi:hypothetical protein